MPSVGKLSMKDVDEMTTKLVYGYVRCLQRLFEDKMKIIPKEVIDLCIMYHFIAEFFLKAGQRMKISTKDAKNDLIMIDSTNSVIGGIWNTSYGNFVVDLNERPNTIYRWTIECNCVYTTIFGLESDEIKFKNIDSYIGGHHFSSRYSLHCPFLASHDENSFDVDMYTSFNLDDTISQIIMELDCNHKTIKYIVNGQDFGVAFKDIDNTHKYRFVVSLADGHIQLLNFQML